MFISQTAYVWVFGRMLDLSLIAGSRHGVVVSLSIIASALTLSVVGLIMATYHARDRLANGWVFALFIGDFWQYALGGLRYFW